MAKPLTNPLVLEDQLCLSTKSIKNYLVDSDTKKTIILEWQRKNEFQDCIELIGSITITITITNESSYIILDYEAGGESYNEKVELIYQEGNIGGGKIWFFLCPTTKTRCRVLHMYNNRFLHRSAIPNGMYHQQILSKSKRQENGFIKNILTANRMSKELQQKWAKITYAGLWTRKMSRLITINNYINYSSRMKGHN